MPETEPQVLVQAAKTLMIDALAMLDRAGAWEASAHLDLALMRLEQSPSATRDRRDPT